MDNIRKTAIDLCRSREDAGIRMALSRILIQNKSIFLEYNRFRKRLFSELAPKDSEIILYLLPWMLSVNDVSIPGYVDHIKQNFRVFNIETEKDILKRERLFKKTFHIQNDLTVLKPAEKSLPVEGIYTIGSVGTISQTSSSDCDLWICIDKTLYDEEAFDLLTLKIDRIKDWMDSRLKMPVCFFLCDVEDIRACRFGGVDCESCGSTQKKVLKEEFYRTAILTAGKIPLWWVAWDRRQTLCYDDAVREWQSAPSVYYDLIDLGNLDFIDKRESFGAALWQFNKSLTHPLKSILKMLLLKMFLESPKEELLCHRFRRLILDQPRKPHSFVDPGAFTLTAVLDFYQNMDPQTLQFILKCFYLRYKVKLFSRTMTVKEETALELFRRYGLDRETIYELNRFSSWTYSSQIRFGEFIVLLLVDIYKDIAHIARDVTGDVAAQDLTILGQKLSASLKKKPHKIPVLSKPLETLKMPSLTLRFCENRWQVFPDNDDGAMIVEKRDLVYCLAYLAWNDLYFPGQLRMLPNPTSAAMQEIINLLQKIREVFGVYDVSSIDFQNFLQPEHTEKLLIIINFAAPPHADVIHTLSVIRLNNWGELFVNRFTLQERFISFLENIAESSYNTVEFFHVQKNAPHSGKLLAKARRLVSKYFVLVDRK